MREESFTKDPVAAVIDGYAGSAKVVGSAAIIMISVFASFVFSRPDHQVARVRAGAGRVD